MTYRNQPVGPALPGTLQQYFQISLFLLLTTGFVTLASTGGLDFISILFVTAALLLRGFQLVANRPWVIPERWTTSLTVLYVGIYLLDYLVLSRQFVASAIHLTLFLMVMRMFSVRRNRDLYFLSAIAFLMILAASVLTVDSSFLLGFSVFLLIAVMTFILMEMQQSAAKATVQPGNHADNKTAQRLAFSLTAVAIGIVLLTLLGATGIFFLLPRTSNGYFTALAPGGGVATGFTDRVELGQIGQIQQSSTVVMHYQFDGDQTGAQDVRWRGISLRDFDGKTWSNPYQPHVLPGFGRNRFDLRSEQERRDPLPRRSSGTLVHYRVLMEPIGINVFFLAPDTKLLAGNYRALAIDGGHSVFNLDADQAIGVYDAWSMPATSEISTEAVSQELADYRRLLPSTDFRIEQLSRRITASQTEDFAKAAAIERYLSTQFGYTLEQPTSKPADPVAFFLFDRKRGHCEYFASAMAIMLRTLNIPSRVITGFRGGEFNDVTSQYVVRASQAHAWVEAYFPERGWVSFDPTPPGLIPPRTGWNRIGLYVDAAASFWREWVVNYDAAHRTTLGRDMTRNSLRIVEQVRRWSRGNYRKLTAWAKRVTGEAAAAPVRWGVIAVSIAVIFLLLLNIRAVLRILRERQLARHPQKSPALASSFWYQRMTRQVARQGWPKTSAQTPAEFVRSIHDETLGRKVSKFTRHYEGARFGDSPEDAQKLPELYEEIVRRK